MSDQSLTTDCPLAELAVGWALHALEPAEEAVVTAHLLECTECARTVDETERVGAVLGLSIPEVAPSPELERRVLLSTSAGPAAPVVPPERPVPRIQKVLRPFSRMLAAAAAMVLFTTSVALGIQVVQLHGERDQAVRQAAAMSEAMRRAADPESTRVPLVARDGRTMGMVLTRPGDVAVISAGLPDNRVTEQIYVLWGIGEGTPTALTGFDVAPAGPVLHDVPSPAGAGDFTGYAVSLESGRHMPAAPTTVIASGQVES